MPSEEVSSCATQRLHQGALTHTTNAHQNTSTQLHVNATIAHKNERLVHVNTTNDGKSFTSRETISALKRLEGEIGQELFQ